MHAVTVTLGPMVPTDVRPLARLHRAAFPGFFLSSLGEPFLVQLYRGFLADDSAVNVVARADDGAVLGAIVGTTSPAAFYGRLARRRWPGIGLACARVVLSRPKVAWRLLRSVGYRGGEGIGEGAALLSSICVAPQEQGVGLGRRLLETWMGEVARRGVDTALLTTDADNNEAVNRFYQKHGWTVSSTYRTPEGRLMNNYSTTLGSR